MTLGLRYAARSDRGLLRALNEDSVYAGPRLLAVADGMGGHAAGEVASAVAIAALAPLDEDAPGADLLSALRDAVHDANGHLRDMVTGDQTLEGMGTTLTALLAAGSRLGLVHVGDSRAYLLRGGALSRITHDHTFVQELVDAGRITEEEAGTHPRRNLVTRALDGRDGLDLDLSVREALPGDRYLLCTDGLTGPVSEESIRTALLEPDPDAAVERLVDLALRGGGPDNVTVVVADVLDDPAGAAPVVAGAAAEHPAPPREVHPDSAAGRAALLEGREPLPSRTAPAAAGQRQRGRGARTALLGLLTLGLVAGGGAAAWAWAQDQYFVGAEGEPEAEVAVFRGLSGSVGGVRLSRVAERSGLPVEELPVYARRQVERGLPAEDLPDARRIVRNLTAAARACATATPSAAPTGVPAAPSAVAAPTATPVPLPSGLPPAAGTAAPSAPAPATTAPDVAASPLPDLALDCGPTG